MAPFGWIEKARGKTTNSSTTVRNEARPNIGAESQELLPLRAGLAALRTLCDGWDGPKSHRPDPEILTAAAAYLEFALRGRSEIATPNLVPVADGGIQAEWYSSQSRFEIYFEADGEIAAWSENRVTGVEMEAEGTDAIQLLIDWACSHDIVHTEIA